MGTKSDKSGLGKTTSEKPVSLHPIPFDEALRDLLAVKPPKAKNSNTHKPKKHGKGQDANEV